MADLDPLIRYRKHGVDEKRRFLSQLYREMEQLELQKKVIQNQMEQEIALAAEMGTPEAQAYLGLYLEGARRKIKALNVSLSKMEARIAAAQEDIRAAFAELKKIEIIQRNREEEEAAAIKRKEEQTLDDIAIEGYRRRLDGEEDEG